MKINIKWNICRICLAGEDEDLEMSSIFSKDEIHLKIADCGGIQIEKEGNLPDLICKKCNAYLNVAYKFRSICQESDQKLQQFLIKSNIPLEKDLKFEIQSEDDDENVEQNESSFEFVSGVQEPIEILPDIEIKKNQIIDSKIFGDPKDIAIEMPLVQNITDYTNQSLDSYLPEGTFIIHEFKEDKKDDELEIDYNDNDDDEGFIYDPEESEIESLLTDEIHKVEENNEPFNKNKTRSKKIITLYPDDFKKPNKQKNFICDICGNVYPRKYSLQNHYKFHLGEKKHKCDLCEKAFVTDNQLIRHIRTHTGERPYACKYCDRRFSDVSTKIKHERIHTNERPYKCDTCGKAFNYSNVLRHHQMVHTGEKPFHCVDCNKKFTKQHQYKAHLLTFAHQQMAMKS